MYVERIWGQEGSSVFCGIEGGDVWMAEQSNKSLQCQCYQPVQRSIKIGVLMW